MRKNNRDFLLFYLCNAKKTHERAKEKDSSKEYIHTKKCWELMAETHKKINEKITPFE